MFSYVCKKNNAFIKYLSKQQKEIKSNAVFHFHHENLKFLFRSLSVKMDVTNNEKTYKNSFYTDD